MTNIDVSKCMFYAELSYFMNDNGYTEFPNYCSAYDGHCLDHLDCYYRQAQHFKKMNESLENELEESATKWCKNCKVEQKLAQIEDRVQDLDNCSENNVNVMNDILRIIQGE